MTSMRSAPGARHLHPVNSTGIEYRRLFTRPDQDPFETVEWERRDAVAADFLQENVEVPTTWSDQSLGIVAKLYFATVDGTREDSVRVMINRVVVKIHNEMCALGYFGDGREPGDNQEIFSDELTYALVHQYVTFNSPVWFNIGVPGRRQTCSACFLLSCKDTMVGPDSITDWWTKESIIFKMGAGSGINISTIRGSMEPLSTGGVASGPVAYMRPADAGAGTLKSGGTHRRAAKLVRLDADHPDIVDFIGAKVREDLRMRALATAGFNLDPTTLEGERNIAECTSFQNENVSVGVTDEFMRQATEQLDFIGWQLKARKTGDQVDVISAMGLLWRIAEAAHKCADPGIQFHDTINRWHTTPSIGPITTSNPCGETYLNDDSACNLASLNVLKYVDNENHFDVDSFCHHVDLMITAMDATCSFSELPTPAIEKNTRELRQLGLGFSNLGAAIMAQGLAYDSKDGRDFSASMCALLTSRAYARSAHLAQHLGAFEHYHENAETMRRVISRHIDHLPAIDDVHRLNVLGQLSVWEAARMSWLNARAMGAEHGFRNSQVTLCQPGGTTSFMLGCDTTGVEPAFSLVTYKNLAGGGTMTMINGTVERALYRLGYDDTVVRKMADALRDSGADIGDYVNPEHRAVFATAVGQNSIEPMGHVRMVAAVQPFLSQGVSKTINMPNDCSVNDVVELYTEAWRMGLKGISIYRDGSKATQVLRTTEKSKWVNGSSIKIISGSVSVSSAPHPQTIHADEIELMDKEVFTPPPPHRRRLPRQRAAHVIKFSIDGHEGYLTAGMYEDGTLGEFFLNGIGKDGSTLRGICDAFATDFSIALQYGVPLETLVRKHSHVSFPPSGMTGDSEIPVASSIVDYIARKLAALFLDVDICEELGVMTDAVKARKTSMLDAVQEMTDAIKPISVSDDVLTLLVPDLGQACQQCGGMMQRTGSCWACPACFATTGCG